MKLTLAGVSHHKAPIELRERVALDVEACRALRGAARRRGDRALHLQSHRALPRARGARGGARGRDARGARRRPWRRSDRRALPSPRRGRGAAPLPRRRRARLARSRRGRDSRPGADGLRGGLARAVPRQALPAGAARRPPRPARDRDQREPRVGAVGGGRACTAGLRRPLGAARARARRGEDERGDQPEPDLARGGRSPSSRTGRWRTARSLPSDSARRRSSSRRIGDGARARRRRRLGDERLRSRAHARGRRRRRFVPARAGRCCWSTSRSRATSIPRSTSSTAASSTTSTISRRSSPRRSPAGAPRRRGPSGSSPTRPTASGNGRRRSTSCPTIASLRALAEEIRDSELARAGGRLSESERKHVESVTSQILAKLLHLPTIRMKEAAAAADGVVYADVVRHLFGLEEEERRR